ncbi:ribbon-helix-helix domain-containing protein [Porticoccaceae bacterium]|nr:ribbon-helix-helix domain-containing protein [Porticoccaceae bacterium]MDC0494806.1 ribbon-helix-helix domain-containing protein [bacterium]MDA8651082.1 ribbon-helix-helix domain-containing protein [Porticoccaceae bacterium]MDA8682256.1 ribbon-helix-helix domain-containing protein [Porticoccaceae bacterium]MDB2634579.1 ribbon-helix-helix domain-containing protein [Porticoccaceae bacterium]
MCQLFIEADQHLWKSRTKSLRIDGVVTSIRLEDFFWDTLEEIAFRDDMTVNQLITRLYFESMDADHDLGNFTSFLRVCCSRYLSLAADGSLTRGEITPIAELNASELLQQETSMRQVRKKYFSGQTNKPRAQH